MKQLPSGDLPQVNYITKIPYQKSNQIALRAVKQRCKYTSNYWLTFLQAKGLNLQVKAGEKGTTLVKVGFNSEDGGEAEQGATGSKFFKRNFTVFNTDQCQKQADYTINGNQLASGNQALLLN